MMFVFQYFLPEKIRRLNYNKRISRRKAPPDVNHPVFTPAYCLILSAIPLLVASRGGWLNSSVTSKFFLCQFKIFLLIQEYFRIWKLHQDVLHLEWYEIMKTDCFLKSFSFMMQLKISRQNPSTPFCSQKRQTSNMAFFTSGFRIR